VTEFVPVTGRPGPRTSKGAARFIERAVVRSGMEPPMAVWNTERGSTFRFSLHGSARYVDLAALMAIGAAPGLLLVWLIPLPLVLPALSIVSFTIACTVALFAHCTGADRHAPSVTLWDVAAVFTLIWIGAGTIGGARQVVQLLDQIAMVPQ
jgi:hypothetical protein